MNLLHRWYCRSDRWAGLIRSRLVPWVLGSAELGESVLEIGPGPGITTEVVRARASNVTLLEIDPWSISALRAKFGREPGVSIVEGDATSMPFEDRRFTAAVCFTMLHHVPSIEAQDRLFTEVARTLRPGGTFLGSDSTDSLRFRLYHLRDTCVPVDPDQFPDRLRAAGFTDVRTDSVNGSVRFRAIRAIRA